MQYSSDMVLGLPMTPLSNGRSTRYRTMVDAGHKSVREELGLAKMADQLLGELAAPHRYSIDSATGSGSAGSTQGAVSDTPVAVRCVSQAEGKEAKQAVSEGGRPQTRWQPKVMDWQSEDQDYQPATSSEGGQQKGGKKRTGRPLTYSGDPNSPFLTEEARRKIKRRISNRESARRIRDRRIEHTQTLQQQVEAMLQQHSILLNRTEHAEAEIASLETEKQLLEQQINNSAAENESLRQEAAILKHAVEANTGRLDGAVGNQDSGLDKATAAGASGSPQSPQAATPFASSEEEGKSITVDPSIFLMPSLDLDRLTAFVQSDCLKDTQQLLSSRSSEIRKADTAMTPLPSLELGKLPSTVLNGVDFFSSIMA